MITLNAPTAHMYGNNFFFKGVITFSSRTSRAWSVKSLLSASVMDKFIKITRQKKKPPDDTNIHIARIEKFKQCLAENKNVFIYGACGTGKTFVREYALDESNSIELSTDLLRAKSLFSELISGSDKHLYIEDYEPDNLILKSVIERTSEGTKLSNGSMVVLSTHFCLYPNFEMIEIPRHDPDTLRVVSPKRYNESAALKCRGNIRDYLSYLEGSDDKDIFESPKEVIYKILCDPEYNFNAEKLSEHGHMWSIFQENYVNSKGVDYARVSMSFSDADIFDSAMYAASCGDWNVMPFFATSAILIPRFYMPTPLKEEKIRPGACWTKHGNYKMRMRKLNSIRLKNDNICIEALCLLQKYAGYGYLEPINSYNITPQDFDTMNHLCVVNKLKPRDVNTIKKKLKNGVL